MIGNILMDAARQGYSIEDIKESVVKMLNPFFQNENSLTKYACNSQLLSIFEFFVRYQYDNEFEKGVKIITEFYRNINRSKMKIKCRVFEKTK